MKFYPHGQNAAVRLENRLREARAPALSVNMEWVRREAKLIAIERRVKIDHLREQIKLHSGPGDFQYLMALRAELIKLYSER